MLKNPLWTTLLLTSALGTLMAQKPAGLPPLVDREIFFGDPEIAGAQLSPDGKYISFLKPHLGARNIWVKGTAEPFSAARVLTAETKRPIPAYFWSRDSKHILFIKDQDGDENFNIYSVDPATTPAPRDLTGVKGIQIQIYSLPKNDPDLLYIGLNDRDKAFHDLYQLKLSTGEKKLVRQNNDRLSSWVFDLNGQLRLATKTLENGDNVVLRADADKFTEVYRCDVFESCGPVRFHKDGQRVYMVTNKGARDRMELVLFDPATGKEDLVEADPLARVDFGGAVFSEVTDELIATTYTDEKTRRYFRDKKLEADYRWLQSKLRGMEVTLGSRTLDETRWLLSANGDTEPSITYLFDRAKRTLVKQYQVRERLPRTALSEMKPVRYPSSDGLEIPAYLTLPKGLAPKGLPTIILPHGGPWARDTWGYDGMVQFFANRGYAVLQPNFRGSTGYGKKFLNAGNGEWGKKMQDDLTWGVKYLTAAGIADPKRVAILGISYGGYATLAGVAYTPELYRAAVDIVGPSNLITLLDSVPPYWESMRKFLHARMADPARPDGQAWLKERSPLNAADQIRTPLMVVQGANDPRVNKAEAEQIVIALRDRKFPVEYMLAPDEGHGFMRPVNNMTMFFAIEKFLSKHLDGRYQQSATPEVEARLRELMVDVSTVKLATKAEAGGLPTVAHPLQAGRYPYQAKISVGGQEIPMKVTTELREADGAWLATDTMETPMGPVSDEGRLDATTLVALGRRVKQGPVAIEIEFGENKATGKMAMNGQERPIAADLGGALLADGPGSAHVVGALALADGFSTVVRSFDVQTQKVRLIKLAVTGSERVTVPAGEFDCFKVERTSAEGGAERSTIWIDKASRKPVKTTAVMPQMNGATMLMELQP